MNRRFSSFVLADIPAPDNWNETFDNSCPWFVHDKVSEECALITWLITKKIPKQVKVRIVKEHNFVLANLG